MIEPQAALQTLREFLVVAQQIAFDEYTTPVRAKLWQRTLLRSPTYDNSGNITQHVDSVMGTWGFNYDTLNRLTSGVPGSGVPSGDAGQNLCMAYDAFGNRTEEDVQSAACSSSDQPTTNYNSNNQVTWVQNTAPAGFTYDAAGNVTYDGSNYYAYDAEGRLCAVQSYPPTGGAVATLYVYDAEGRWVAKMSIPPSSNPPSGLTCDPAQSGAQIQNQYILAQSGEKVTTVDASGAWLRTNVYANGTLFATYDEGGLHFQLNDPLGTRRVQTNYQGWPELQCQSLPFGDQLTCVMPSQAAPTADDSTSIHFTGKERDAESGNDYFGARYYASTMGRFLSPDWSAKVDPVPYAKLDDPQSLNLYSYVWNNPLSRTDPDGHQCDTCQKVWNWLTSSHSASASASATAGQGGASNGFLSANARGGTAQASASASYGLNTSASAKASASVAEATVNEGTHSTSQMNGVTANAGASVGVGLGGKAGVGVSASAGANADVLTASQTEKINIGPVTITGGASGAVGIGANASVSLGTGGVGASAGAAFGYGGGLSINISWGGVAGTAGASVKGTMDSTTTTINKPEVQPQ